MPKGKAKTPQAVESPTAKGKKKEVATPEVKPASKQIAKKARTSSQKDSVDGPAKPLSSYAIFLKQMSAQMKNMPKFNDLTLSERAKVISESWSKLSADQKAQYVEMANNDKLRYQNECAKSGIKQIGGPGSGTKRGAAEKEKVVVQEKKDDDVVKPKRPSTAFLFFGMDNGAKLKKKNPDLKVGDIAKANGEAWAKLTDKQKEPYVAKNNKDKERYEKETNQLKELGYFINSDGHKSTDLDKNHNLREFPKDCLMPKKKKTAYVFYFSHYHENNKEALKGLGVAEVARKISASWAETADKSKFETMAENDAKRYDDQINALKTNGFFMMEDGTKSSEHAAKKPKQKRAKKEKPE